MSVDTTDSVVSVSHESGTLTEMVSASESRTLCEHATSALVSNFTKSTAVDKTIRYLIN